MCSVATVEKKKKELKKKKSELRQKLAYGYIKTHKDSVTAQPREERNAQPYWAIPEAISKPQMLGSLRPCEARKEFGAAISNLLMVPQ